MIFRFAFSGTGVIILALVCIKRAKLNETINAKCVGKNRCSH